jgi:predicted nuclease with TOPRIM domain
MDEATYKVWWPLHIRAAKGETLNAEEHSIYEAGCRALDAEERLDGRLEELKQARQRTEVLEVERARLQTRYEALRAEIAELETNLSEPIRQALGVKER